MNQQPMQPGDAYVQSFARGLAVIRSFGESRPAQTLTEVATETGLTRAGARRILLTLQSLGYVASEGRLFRLTPKILDLGFAYLTALPFWHLAEPVLAQLSAAAGESVSASVLDGADIVYVLRVPTQKIMAIDLAVGSRLPAYCSAMGRVLLSGLPDDALTAFYPAPDIAPRTPATLTTPIALGQAIAQVRTQGWALVDQELEAGLISLAAPIMDRHGRIIAAMNISTNAHRHTARQTCETYLPLLLRAAATVSQMVAQRGT